MEEREIRIGNWFKHNDDWCYRGEEVHEFQWEIRDWFAVGEGLLFLQNIEPIPLTEEWLIKLGAEEMEWEHAPNYKLGRFDIEDLSGIYGLNLGVCIRSRYDSERSLLIAEVKYVHQFQNLFYDLGEELTLK